MFVDFLVLNFHIEKYLYTEMEHVYIFVPLIDASSCLIFVQKFSISKISQFFHATCVYAVVIQWITILRRLNSLFIYG